MAWTPQDVTNLVKEIGVILLALVGAISGILGYTNSHAAKAVAESAEVRTQATEKRVDTNAEEIKGLRFGAHK